MKNFILIITSIIAIMCSPASQANNDIYIFGGIFAYNEGASGTKPDYKGLSPNGSYGIGLEHKIDESTSFSIGWKHESSISYREEGSGFNGFFFEAKMKLDFSKMF